MRGNVDLTFLLAKLTILAHTFFGKGMSSPKSTYINYNFWLQGKIFPCYNYLDPVLTIDGLFLLKNFENMGHSKVFSKLTSFFIFYMPLANTIYPLSLPPQWTVKKQKMKMGFHTMAIVFTLDKLTFLLFNCHTYCSRREFLPSWPRINSKPARMWSFTYKNQNVWSLNYWNTMDKCDHLSIKIKC